MQFIASFTDVGLWYLHSITKSMNWMFSPIELMLKQTNNLHSIRGNQKIKRTAHQCLDISSSHIPTHKVLNKYI